MPAGHVHGQHGAVRGHDAFRHGTVVSLTKRSDQNRDIGRVGPSRLLSDGGDVQGQRTIAGEGSRRLPIATVACAFSTGLRPELIAGVGKPCRMGAVPHPVHRRHVGCDARRSKHVGRAFQIDTRFVNRIAGGVIHGEPKKEARLLRGARCQHTGCRGVERAARRTL